MKSTTPATSTRSQRSSAATGLQLAPAAVGTRIYLTLADRLSWGSLLRQALPASTTPAAATIGLEPASSSAADLEHAQVISTIGQPQIQRYSATARVAKIEVKTNTCNFKTGNCCNSLSDMRRLVVVTK
jgi:hypothetical protein